MESRSGFFFVAHILWHILWEKSFKLIFPDPPLTLSMEGLDVISNFDVGVLGGVKAPELDVTVELHWNMSKQSQKQCQGSDDLGFLTSLKHGIWASFIVWITVFEVFFSVFDSNYHDEPPNFGRETFDLAIFVKSHQELIRTSDVVVKFQMPENGCPFFWRSRLGVGGWAWKCSFF